MRVNDDKQRAEGTNGGFHGKGISKYQDYAGKEWHGKANEETFGSPIDANGELAQASTTETNRPDSTRIVFHRRSD